MDNNPITPKQNRKQPNIAIIIFGSITAIFVIAAMAIALIQYIREQKRNHTPPDLVWIEEVQLQNGKVIKVQQRITAASHPDYAFNRGDHAKELEVVDTAGLGAPPPKWSHIWRPILIDQDKNGVWFLVIKPTSCYDWNSFYLFREYKAIDGKWQQVEFEIKKLDGRKANLEWAIGYNGKIKPPEYLPLSQKPFHIPHGRISESFITPNAYSQCETPCIRNEQGKLLCGWQWVCPYDGHKKDWYITLNKCIKDYEDNVLTPKFMTKRPPV